VRYLVNYFQKSVAILGVGLDGHTGGIAGNRIDFIDPLFDNARKSLLVSEFNDGKGFFKERITMTFSALSMVDILLVLVFGKDKKKALKLMFSEGKIEEVPSRFFLQTDIAVKTLFFTDQKV